MRGYDYSLPGAYFVTICTLSRACLFGDVVGGALRLNEAGKMIEKWWAATAKKFQSIETGEYVVMPDHFHGVLINVGADPRVRPLPAQGAHIGAPLHDTQADHTRTPLPGQRAQGAHTGAPLQEVVQWFKTMTTNGYIRGIRRSGWSAFTGKLWQRSYYERVIRNEDELNRARQYILDNPAKWAEGSEHRADDDGQPALPEEETW